MSKHIVSDERESIRYFGDVYACRIFDVSSEIKNYICNFESPIVQGAPPEEGKVNLCVEADFVSLSLKNKPTAFCLSNNHIFDFGQKGISSTIDKLESENIQYFGAGLKEDNYNNPLIIKHNDINVALLGYVCSTTHPASGEKYGAAIINETKILNDISEAKKNGAERIVLNLHWGDEEVIRPKPKDVKLARRLIDAGVDLIIGHHAHCIQSWEKHNGKYIFYGLGNMYFEDIDLASHFDKKKNEFQKKYKKKQKRWNKESLSIKYEPNSNKVDIELFSFEGRELSKVKNIKENRSWMFNCGIDSENIYRVIKILCLLRVSYYAYISNPRMPRISDFKLIMYIFRVKK